MPPEETILKSALDDHIQPTSICMASSAVPKNWPPSLPYLTASTLSPTLSASCLSTLQTPPPPTSRSSPIPSIPTSQTSKPCPLVRITTITSPTHPANGQCGLFATQHLAPGTFILAYHGVIHSSTSTLPTSATTESPPNTTTVSPPQSPDPDPHATSDYDLTLLRQTTTTAPLTTQTIAIDAALSGNEARFINDFRGVPGVQSPNAEFREIWEVDDSNGSSAGVKSQPSSKVPTSSKNGNSAVTPTGEITTKGRRGMGVFVLPPGGLRSKAKVKGGKGKRVFEGISVGEEILVSYGRGFWGARREEVVGDEENGDRGIVRGDR